MSEPASVAEPANAVQGEYARCAAERPERLAAIRAYLDMLDASDDRRGDTQMYLMIALELARL